MERASTPPNEGQKPLPTSEMRDEDKEDVPDKEFKQIMLKFVRDHEKKWEDFKNNIVTEIQVKTKMTDMEFKMQSLTNRINTAEERISKLKTHVLQIPSSLNSWRQASAKLIK